MKKLLWLDDTRDPIDGIWYEWLDGYLAGVEKYKITWVRNYEDFKESILEEFPDLIFFDHDLGEDEAIERRNNGMSRRQARKFKKQTKSGADCAKWLTKYCLDHNKALPDFYSQSQNPEGKQAIVAILNNFKQHGGRRTYSN